MKVFTIAGARETGKTTIAKKLIEKTNSCVVFDANKNYPELTLVTMDKIKSGKKQRIISDQFELFMKVTSQLKNISVVFEEATIFFGQRTSEENFKRLVISCRHSNVVLIFIFHSIMDIPKFVLRQTDYLYLKKTGDMDNDIKYTRNQNVYDAWKRIMNSPNHYETEIIKIL